ncbi:MAG TPA: hypothetical protein EYP57_02185 [Thermodesulfobacteriaceae bacterium]|nr:hypothetical protein [Thermodesulfobacteriaceae bacterium]
MLGLGIAEYALILGAVCLVHVLLLAINRQVGKMLRLPTADLKALVFVTSQKTLPISVAVLTGIEYDTGSAVIVLLMFHFMQIFMDSSIASYLHRKTD